MKRLHIAVGVLLIVFGVAAPQLIGASTPGYSARADFLSELGQSGAPFADLMNFGVFLPVGVLWAAGVALLWRALPRGASGAIAAALLFGNSISYFGAAFFPCDAGCPASGSFSQGMHNLTGAVGYFLSPAAFALLGAHLIGKRQSRLGALTIGVAALSAISFVAMLGDMKGSNAGLWQRLTDYSLFFWMLAAALMVRRA